MEVIDSKNEDGKPNREVVSAGENELAMSDEFLSNFKSMYYTLNATPDTQMKVFNEGKIITLSDIEELCSKVNEKMKNHEVIVETVTIHMSFSDGRHEKLSIPEFARKDLKVAAATKTVTINWDFYVKTPGYKVPQRHSLTVRMGSKLRPDEYFKIMMESDDDSEIESMMADLVCRVDYVNAVLSEELINRVQGWYESLPEDVQESKIMKFLYKHSVKLNKLIELLSPIAAILLIFGWTEKYLNANDVSGIFNSSEQLSNVLLWLALSIILVLTSKYFGYLVAIANHRRSKKLQEYSHLLLTKGDENQRRRAKKNNDSVLRSISINFIAAFLVTIVISLWGFFI